MSDDSSIVFQNPRLLVAGVALGLAIVAIFLLRRRRLPVRSVTLGLAGLVLLCLGAGGISLKWAGQPAIVVMVDLSPSTRTARYRDVSFLRQRVDQLLGSQPHRFIRFSGHNIEGPLDRPAGELVEMESDRTIFDPPADGSAVLLFSDGQFELPSITPKVFPVVDPNLQSPADAAVMEMDRLADRAGVRTSVRGAPRLLHVDERMQTINPPGWMVMAMPAGDSPVVAWFEKADAWPQNDRMELWPMREMEQWWWVGEGAPTGWRTFSAEQLPIAAADYLHPSVIVLNNVPADRLTDAQQRRLEQYVRDLGGALLIVGGDQSFSAGGSIGSRLEELSPLSSQPPRPTVHWILLADASGSMAQPVAGTTRWEIARAAMREVISQLPPEDLLSIGSFSDRVTWWSTGKSVRQTHWPVDHVTPHGPTNLTAVLDGLGEELKDGLPKQLLLLTDGQAPPPDGRKLIESYRKADLHFHLLALGPGEAVEVLREVARATGGSVVEQFDAQRWVRSARDWLRGVMAGGVSHRPVKMKWIGPAGSGDWYDARISTWNRAWLKPRADLWGKTTGDAQENPLAAHWNLGLGQVTALAFAAPNEMTSALAHQVAGRPRDPHWKVRWNIGPEVEVSVESTGEPFINAAAMKLRIAGQDEHEPERTITIPQTSPGRYALRFDAPRSASYAAVEIGGRLVDRRALAGMYALEYAAIGNNLTALRALADRSGGRLIEPADRSQLDLAGNERTLPLRSAVVFVGAMLVLGAAAFGRK
ncbi:MAG: VWA domain-containing protein [Phycisphaerales bacterium]|nr:VWA domain-containing protein [Phycisphaerales bacterium]